VTPAVVGGVAAGAVAWSIVGPRAAARLPRAAAPRWSPPSLTWLEARSAAAVLAGGAALPVVVLAGPAVGLAVAVLVAALASEVRGELRDRRRAAVAAAWLAALGATAVALSAGLTLPDALARGGRVAGSRTSDAPATALGAAAAAARLGGDIVGVLEARCPTGVGARLVACLRVAVGTGVPPAILAVRLGEAVAAEEQAGRAATVALASARATTRVLAVLPLAGIGLAGAFGASAPAYLLGSATGHACLLAGAVLEAAGLRWSARLVRRDAP
jgi:tight adherence protein B